MKMELEVLDSKTGKSKRGNDYTIALVRVDGSVFKLFSDVNLSEYVGQQLKCEVELKSNQEMFGTPRITEVL